MVLYPSAILGRWGIVVCSGICLFVRLSIQFLTFGEFYQYLRLVLTFDLFVPCTIILALRPLTLTRWPLPWLCLLPQNCLNETSHQAKTVHFLHFANISDEFEGQWPWLTFDQLFKDTDHHDLELCLLVQYCHNKTSHQCQNGTFGEFYQYLKWVLTVDLFFKVR